jgi:hypothetical protein
LILQAGLNWIRSDHLYPLIPDARLVGSDPFIYVPLAVCALLAFFGAQFQLTQMRSREQRRQQAAALIMK